MTTMRAKVILNSIEKTTYGEKLKFNAVPKGSSYPEDGSDENNTYAKFSPSAEFVIQVANPALFDQFKPGESYYVDFTPAPTTATK